MNEKTLFFVIFPDEFLILWNSSMEFDLIFYLSPDFVNQLVLNNKTNFFLDFFAVLSQLLF